uniref:Uncharacterized protein n=1 Tax=Oryza sativa subsp. japonica TaxID=39947 RepID=Q8LNV1_ORYSJ|nr:hypothetical protein [Oryza sativa Japonica Group]
MACELVALDMETREFEVIVQGPPCRHGEGKMTVLELHGALCVACSDMVMMPSGTGSVQLSAKKAWSA